MPRTHDPLFWLVMARDGIGFAVAAGRRCRLVPETNARDWPMTYAKVEYAMTGDVGGGWKSNLLHSYPRGRRVLLRTSSA
jgi:hypothetical protein